MTHFEKIITADKFNVADKYLSSDFMVRHYHLMWRDKTKFEEHTRKLLFCIIAGDAYLYSKVNAIYDFESRTIKRDCLKDPKIRKHIFTTTL